MPEPNFASNAPSCRLRVVLARDAPVGVIFRRGPSKMVRLILWNTEDDTFLPGQWFHGLLSDYDLTPNGRYLTYYAGKYTGSRTGNHHEVPITNSWTAISRPPYLTALALWQTTYGAVWESNRDLRLNISHNDGETHPDFPLPPNISLVNTPRPKPPGGPIVGQSGLRRGWTLYEQHLKADIPTYKQPRIWNKEDKSKQYRLIYNIPGEGNETASDLDGAPFSLQHLESQIKFALPEGTCWADWDLQGRLVWARQGELWAMTLPDEEVGSNFFAGATLLADFTNMVWEDVPAPDWAKRW